jgi:hypothetical protein
VEVCGWDSVAASVSLGGKAIERMASIDRAKHALSFEINDQSHGSELEIRLLN